VAAVPSGPVATGELWLASYCFAALRLGQPQRVIKLDVPTLQLQAVVSSFILPVGFPEEITATTVI
jgi:hypothetical protein